MANSRSDQGLISEMNDMKVSSFHIKTWLLSGMGFFTDAYDLFIIGTVISILPLAGWNSLDTASIAMLSSVSLLSSVIGAVLFGRLLDMVGRKSIYGTELVLLIAGAIGSAVFVPVNGVSYLLFWRTILGLGIGGDYATSSTIMTEYSNTKNRGQLVGMVFSLQGVGLLAGPLIALLLFDTIGNIGYIWRILFAIGAIPAILVVYGRRKLPETPKYSLRVRGDASSAKRDWERVSGNSNVILSAEDLEIAKMKWYNILTDRRFVISLIGTAGAWFLMDWAFYGNSIMSHQMLSVIVPSAVSGIAAIKMTTIYTAMIFGIAAFPAYWIATFTVDRIGRKKIQILGFSVMAIAYLVLGSFHFLMSASYAIDFLVIYGLSYFFIEFGPNVTTFIYGPEMYPTPIRGLGSGISSAGGKFGAFVGTFLNVIVDAVFGESTLFIILAAISVAGSILTAISLPETKGRTLEDISGEKRYLVSSRSSAKK